MGLKINEKCSNLNLKVQKYISNPQCRYALKNFKLFIYKTITYHWKEL